MEVDTLSSVSTVAHELGLIQDACWVKDGLFAAVGWAGLVGTFSFNTDLQSLSLGTSQKLATTKSGISGLAIANISIGDCTAIVTGGPFFQVWLLDPHDLSLSEKHCTLVPDEFGDISTLYSYNQSLMLAGHVKGYITIWGISALNEAPSITHSLNLVERGLTPPNPFSGFVPPRDIRKIVLLPNGLLLVVAEDGNMTIIQVNTQGGLQRSSQTLYTPHPNHGLNTTCLSGSIIASGSCPDAGDLNLFFHKFVPDPESGIIAGPSFDLRTTEKPCFNFSMTERRGCFYASTSEGKIWATSAIAPDPTSLSSEIGVSDPVTVFQQADNVGAGFLLGLSEDYLVYFISQKDPNMKSAAVSHLVRMLK